MPRLTQTRAKERSETAAKDVKVMLEIARQQGFERGVKKSAPQFIIVLAVLAISVGINIYLLFKFL